MGFVNILPISIKTGFFTMMDADGKESGTDDAGKGTNGSIKTAGFQLFVGKF